MANFIWPPTLSGAVATWRHPAPALECMAKTGCLAKAKLLGDPAHRHILFAKHLLGPGKAQVIEQTVVAGTQRLQMPA